MESIDEMKVRYKELRDKTNHLWRKWKAAHGETIRLGDEIRVVEAIAKIADGMVAIEPALGETIFHECEVASRIANAGKCRVDFTFNGVKMVASPGMTVDEICEPYTRLL